MPGHPGCRSTTPRNLEDACLQLRPHPRCGHASPRPPRTTANQRVVGPPITFTRGRSQRRESRSTVQSSVSGGTSRTDAPPPAIRRGRPALPVVGLLEPDLHKRVRRALGAAHDRGNRGRAAFHVHGFHRFLPLPPPAAAAVSFSAPGEPHGPLRTESRRRGPEVRGLVVQPAPVGPLDEGRPRSWRSARATRRLRVRSGQTADRRDDAQSAQEGDDGLLTAWRSLFSTLWFP